MKQQRLTTVGQGMTQHRVVMEAAQGQVWHVVVRPSEPAPRASLLPSCADRDLSALARGPPFLRARARLSSRTPPLPLPHGGGPRAAIVAAATIRISRASSQLPCTAAAA
uniref:Uncharacterized protein n=1 Tax=Oryza punctata TaxID=4537 RepID=A0A0E0K129_ORYPU